MTAVCGVTSSAQKAHSFSLRLAIRVYSFLQPSNLMVVTTPGILVKLPLKLLNGSSIRINPKSGLDYFRRGRAKNVVTKGGPLTPSCAVTVNHLGGI
jgi:hypothetical protein